MTACNAQQARQQSGFSYLWMLFLVALMGVGLTLAAEIDATVSQRNREQALLATGRQFQRAIASYYESPQEVKKNEYPANVEDLLQDPRFPGVKRHLRKVFVDPMTGTTQWGWVRLNGRIVGVHSLAEGKPIKHAHFEADVAHFERAQKYAEWVFTYPSDLLIKTDSTDTATQTPSVSPKMPGKKE